MNTPSAVTILPGIPVGWPEIVQYRRHDNGRLCACPPPDVPYDLVIHDLEKYEELARTGRLYAPEHRGPLGKMVDNRSTS